jgi:trimethylamine:corrinoid methyltransferase-like protein
LARYKTGYYNSRVYPRLSMEEWQLQGQPSAQKVLREKTVELMAAAIPPDDHDDLMARGEAFIAALDV